MTEISRSPEETERIGFRIGRRLGPGSVVALYGDLGAGKTTMAKGIAAALGIDPRDVTSPTFTIVCEHPGKVPLYHIDLYRTAGPDDLESSGAWDAVGGGGIAVIEWPERASGGLPEGAICVRISCGEGGERSITIEGLDEDDRDHL
ncbi:MAG: hypothetical protein OHK006_00260 [Thermodesulfovibrionales bacterium]